MALFGEKGEGNYELAREGEDVILRIDAFTISFPPTIEDSGQCMSFVIEKLIESRQATKIVFSEKRDYEYDYEQTRILSEIAHLYNLFLKQKKVMGFNPLDIPACVACGRKRYPQIPHIIMSLMASDPVGCYIELLRNVREEKIEQQKELTQSCSECSERQIQVFEQVLSLFDKTKMIQFSKPYLAGYKIGDRSVYRKIFSPSIKPNFMYTKLMATYPTDAEELDNYSVEDSEVTIFSLPDSLRYLYHVSPPEFRLSEDKYDLFDLARNIMAEHKPRKEEFVDPQRMRQVFFNVGHDLLEELSISKGIKLKEKELQSLTKILVRYTVGFGLIEVLLGDEKVQDVTINSPFGNNPIFIVHQDFGDCHTNIYPTASEAESWASKLRLISGRPLDEANPILDTELNLATASARVAVIAEPLNPTGLAFALRRHRDKPWTLPLFVKQRMIDPLGAGLLSFLIDGSRTLLVAGTRSAGKTSLLGSLMVEIMRKYRMITIEDTLELPVPSLRKLGYNIQSMKVASALTRGTTEVAADEGIRATLRLGDSTLIVGEVRSTEARALYEAMRVGALANVVAGTIHGDSPYGVFDRVVNDLGVPRTSFKATDIIVVANPIRSADGLHRWRRVTQITEVRKQWEEDPLAEGGFVDLMTYDPKKDQLLPSGDLLNGESDILKSIAGNVREWAGNWDAVWDNVLLRAKIKEALVEISDKLKNPDLLEAPFVIQSNDEFHRISDQVKEETGFLDSKKIFFEWNEWLKQKSKEKKQNV